MTKPSHTRRREPRVTLPETVTGEVSGGHEVLILDLSFGGARLAHTDILQPGDTCFLRFILQDSPIALTARIAWSSAMGRAPDGVVLYESGLAFDEVPDAVRASLAAFFQSPSLPVAMAGSVECNQPGSQSEKQCP
jgi:hypothetical protein